jgi:selenide, water dikinase
MDVITPVTDDARAFGRIAAANALSDVYAMGGTPQVALSFAGMPSELGLEALRDVLLGAAEKAAEAGCAIVGGHTIKDTEPKCGLAVIGLVEGPAWTHKGGHAGQRLVLTKPLGTGAIAQALRVGAAEPAWERAAVASMEALNASAKQAGRAAGATAATDVTGFGLLGHMRNLLEASGVSARIDAEAVPLLPGAYEAAAAGHVPGGSKGNLRYVSPWLDGVKQIDPVLLALLADAQTSGGLLLAVPEASVASVLAALPGAALIGELVSGRASRLQLVEAL